MKESLFNDLINRTQLFASGSITLSPYRPHYIIITIPLYDRFLVPITIKISWHHSWTTMLQRVGLGLCLSLLNMVVAALVEAKRVTISAKEYDLMDKLEAIFPMSVWWLLPQYILCGLANMCWAPRIVHWSNARVLEKLGSSNICYCYRSWKLDWISYYIYCAGYQLKLWWKMAW